MLIDALREPRTFGFVWPSAEPECFHLFGITVGRVTRWMGQPVPGPLVFPILHLVVPPSDEWTPVVMDVPLDEDLSRLLTKTYGRAVAIEGEPLDRGDGDAP